MVGKDNPDCGGKVGDNEIGRRTKRLVIAMINKNGTAAGCVTAVNIAPAVSQHPAACEIQAEVGCGGVQHGRFGLTAVARLAVVGASVIAHFHQVNLRHQGEEPGMHGFDCGLCLRAAPHVGLVGCYDQMEAGALQLGATGCHSREQNKFFQAGRRIGFPVFDYRSVERAVAIQKNGWLKRRWAHDEIFFALAR